MATKKIYDKKDFTEWGKLGGRPHLNSNKKTERLNLFFTKKEMEFIIEQSNEKQFEKVNDYARFMILEKKLPNYEQDRVLVSYVNNFSRISNFMKMGIFTETEKTILLQEIDELIIQMKKKISWLK